MKKTRWFAGLLALLMVGSVVGCNVVNDPDAASSESIVTSTVSEDSNSDTESNGVVSDGDIVSDGTDGNVSAGDNISQGKNNTSSTSSGSTAIKFGVTTTKKMPNYISKITSSTLKILASDRGSEKTEAEMIKAFKAVTGKDLKIERTVVEWRSMPNRLAGMVMANSSPDVFSISNVMAPYLVRKPYFEDIEKYIDLNDALWKPSKDANTSLFTYKGKRYCVVSGGELGVGGNGYIYNKKLVSEAISTNKKLYDPLQMFYDGKWTWDTLYEFVNEINLDSNGDGVPEVYGHVMEGSRISAYLMTTGEDIIKTDAKGNFVYNLESPNVIRALNFIKKLGKVCNDPAPWEGMSKVVAGKAGFFFGSPFWMKDSNDSLKAKKEGKIAWVPMPRDPQTSTVYTSTAGDAMFIPLNAKNPYLAGAYYYFSLYLNKNPNPSLEKKTKEVYKNEYGWTDDEIKLYTGKVTVPNLKGIISGYGERIDGFSPKGEYNAYAFDPDKTVANTIEIVGPGLKQAIIRFNKS